MDLLLTMKLLLLFGFSLSFDSFSFAASEEYSLPFLFIFKNNRRLTIFLFKIAINLIL